MRFKLLKVFKRKININIVRTASTDSYIETVDLAYSTCNASDKTSTKPPLITFHGIIGSKNNWNKFGRGVNDRTGIKVINIDARNHGGSQHSPQHTYLHMAHDVIKLLQKLNISKVSVIGHSMGGRTAMVLSLLRPDLISSMTIVDILPVKTDPQIFNMIALFDAMAAVPFSSGISISKARELADEKIKMVTLDTNVRSYLLENIIQTETGSYSWRLNLPILKASFNTEMATFPPSLMGSRYPGPSLFVAGSLSNFIGPSDMSEIRKFFPLGEVAVIDGGGHWVHTQKHEEFLEVVCKFLTENT